MANEKRLIDANAFVKQLQTDFKKVFTSAGEKVKPEDYFIKRRTVFYEDFYKEELDGFCLMVNCFPTADTVEVAQGRWIRYEDIQEKSVKYICSNCGDYHAFRNNGGSPFLTSEHTFNENFIYCRKCGAKMDGDGNG